MPEASFSIAVVSSVPVVAAPEEIDITNVARLRAALLDAAARDSGTLVVDMARTEFCDSAGLNALVRAHQRAQAQGGETSNLDVEAALAVVAAVANPAAARPSLAQCPNFISSPVEPFCQGS